MARARLNLEITPQVVLRAYSLGLFPMSESADDKDLFWVEPEARGVFPLDGLIVTKSLAKMVRSDRYEIRADSDFDLLAVLPDGLPEAAYSHKAVAAPVVACGLPFDVVPCSWSDFMTDREVTDSLVHRAVSEGRLLYQDRALRRNEAPQ